MQQFDFETIKETLNPAKFLDQAEKNAQAVLSYVQPKELGNTLVTLSKDIVDFARAQLTAVESITAIAKSQAEDLVKSFTKSGK
jgi:hypothetical protein